MAIKYNGKEYDAPNAAWTEEAPAMYRETPEGLEQMWSAGYGGKGWENAMNNFANLSPLEQDILTNVNAKYANNGSGSFGGAASSYGDSGYGSGSFGYGQYTPGQWDGHSNVYLDALNSVMGYQPFSYDYTKDPLYKVYSDEYTRLGQRAMDDTLAKISARTGGLASSYAATAGNQAYGNYMQELAGKIPELRNQAYNEWQGNFNNLLNKYNVANGYDTFDYNVFSDDQNRKYQAWNANTALAQYENEQARADQLAAANLRAQYGDMGGLADIYGIQNLQGLYDAKKAENEAGNAIYAFADDGGDPYRISTTLGQGYINSLMPGQSVTANDGSVWRKDDLGNVTITDRTGRTFKISSGKSAPAYSGYLQAPDTGGNDTGSFKVNMGDVNALGIGPASAEAAVKYALENGYIITVEDGEYRIKKPTVSNLVNALDKKYTPSSGRFSI